MHVRVFETKQNIILVNVVTVQSVNTRKHYTAQKKKIKVLAFSLFFPTVKQGFPQAVYSLGCLTFHKHFSLRNYTKHV